VQIYYSDLNMELSDEEQVHIQKSHPIIIELITHLISQLQIFKERVHEFETLVRELENRLNSNSTTAAFLHRRTH